jgi:hypothetical protein
MMCCSEHSNKFSGSVTGEEFIVWLSDSGAQELCTKFDSIYLLTTAEQEKLQKNSAI